MIAERADKLLAASKVQFHAAYDAAGRIDDPKERARAYAVADRLYAQQIEYQRQVRVGEAR